MDSNSENSAFVRTSLLRPPSKIPSPAKALSEISESVGNSRATAMLPPQSTISLKHKTSAPSEPAAKRPTLVERAGEPIRANQPAPPSSRPINSTVKATTLAGTRNNFSSSVSGRPTSTYSRSISNNGSFSSSTGSGIRPPSAQSRFRPQSSLGHGRHASSSSGYGPASRPASAMDSHSVGMSGRLAAANRKGMTPAPIPTCQAATGLAGSRETERHSLPSWSGSQALPVAAEVIQTPGAKSHRNLSINTAISSLRNSESTMVLSREETRTRGLFGPSPSSTASRRLGFDTSRSSTSPQYYLTRHSIDSFSLQSQHIGQNVLPKPPSRAPRRSTRGKLYLTRETSTTAFDPTERLEDVEMDFARLQRDLNETGLKLGKSEELKGIYEAKINQLEAEKGHLRNEIELDRKKLASSQKKVESLQTQLATAVATIEDERRIVAEEQLAAAEDQRIQQAYIEGLMSDHREELESQENDHRQKIQNLRQQANEDANRLQGLNADGIRELERARADLEREKLNTKRLQETLAESSTTTLQLQSADRAKQAKIDYLESDGQAQAQSFADVLRRMQEAQDAEEAVKEKLRAEESVIRKLRNQVQELKGNIRVFCRVRPVLEENEEPARIALPDAGLDSSKIEVQGPEEKSSLGTVTTKTNAFTFDRVFGPSSQNPEVFEEISQLVQSALDGYNVCIFCYGQTGAGKTHTMSADDGMIPLALHQIYDTARTLEEKGWKYTMEGSFVEVHNEALNDLLGKPEDYDKTKHEIRHDAQTCKTTVTDLTAVVLDSPTKVESILKRATSNRTVAATKANERSSRSHSVFILRLSGVNEVTGEKSDGTLNLVDLAGSERLSHSGSTGDRLKETQNINKSLSCLGDVIGALGQGKEGGHVPYRNSKLTYLLRYSLGGNSKTLMFVMVSPLQAHLNETLTSLKFATKVSNTYIGTARRTTGKS
ncbi:MAG: kinesin-like nuclear fusion protein [Geoglossum simile]|nr:MAG: kinesin-like nuclear fusion protein [Geoglossum simile]